MITNLIQYIPSYEYVTIFKESAIKINELVEELFKRNNPLLISNVDIPITIFLYSYVLICLHNENTAISFFKSLKEKRMFKNNVKYFLILEETNNISSLYQQTFHEDVLNLYVMNKKENIIYYADYFHKFNKCGKAVDITTEKANINKHNLTSWFSERQVNMEHCKYSMYYMNTIYSPPILGQNTSKSHGLGEYPFLLLSEYKKLQFSFVVVDEIEQKRLQGNTYEKLFEEILNRNGTDITMYTNTQNDDAELFEISKIYFQDDYLWVAPLPKMLPTYIAFISVYSHFVWFLIFLAMMAFTITYSFLQKSQMNLGSMYFYVIALTFNYTQRFNPICSRLRMLLILYIFFSFNVCYIYVGFMSSLLTKPNFEEAIRTVQGLVDSPYKPHVHNFVEEIYKSSSLKYAQGLKFVPVRTPIGGILRINSMMQFRNTSTAIHSSLVELYDLKSSITVVGKDLLPTIKYYFLLRKHNPFIHVLNDVITRIGEGGLDEVWISKFVEKHFDVIEEKKHVLSFEKLQSIFMLMIIGFIVAFVVFILELYGPFLRLKIKVSLYG